MANPYIGEIKLVGFNFAPVGWALCNGQLLAISDNTVLFSLIGTTYGGDGANTFALPNLQSRIAVDAGHGPSLVTYSLGQHGGVESVTLTNNQIPAHTHPIATSGSATTTIPSNAYPAVADQKIYSGAATSSHFAPTVVGQAGGGQPHYNIQPILVMNYIIALEGIYPS